MTLDTFEKKISLSSSSSSLLSSLMLLSSLTLLLLLSSSSSFKGGFKRKVLAKTPGLYQIPKLRNLKSGKNCEQTNQQTEGPILSAGRGKKYSWSCLYILVCQGMSSSTQMLGSGFKLKLNTRRCNPTLSDRGG